MPGGVPRIARGAEDEIVGDALPAELRRIGLADEHGAGFAQPRDARRIFSRQIVGQKKSPANTGRRGPALGREQLLDAARNPVERAEGARRGAQRSSLARAAARAPVRSRWTKALNFPSTTSIRRNTASGTSTRETARGGRRRARAVRSRVRVRQLRRAFQRLRPPVSPCRSGSRRARAVWWDGRVVRCVLEEVGEVGKPRGELAASIWASRWV